MNNNSKRKAGRPPKPGARNQAVPWRIQPSTLSYIRFAADAANISPGELVEGLLSEFNVREYLHRHGHGLKK